MSSTVQAAASVPKPVLQRAAVAVSAAQMYNCYAQDWPADLRREFLGRLDRATAMLVSFAVSGPDPTKLQSGTPKIAFRIMRDVQLIMHQGDSSSDFVPLNSARWNEAEAMKCKEVLDVSQEPWWLHYVVRGSSIATSNAQVPTMQRPVFVEPAEIDMNPHSTQRNHAVPSTSSAEAAPTSPSSKAKGKGRAPRLTAMPPEVLAANEKEELDLLPVNPKPCTHCEKKAYNCYVRKNLKWGSACMACAKEKCRCSLASESARNVECHATMIDSAVEEAHSPSPIPGSAQPKLPTTYSTAVAGRDTSRQQEIRAQTALADGHIINVPIAAPGTVVLSNTATGDKQLRFAVSDVSKALRWVAKALAEDQQATNRNLYKIVRIMNRAGHDLELNAHSSDVQSALANLDVAIEMLEETMASHEDEDLSVLSPKSSPSTSTSCITSPRLEGEDTVTDVYLASPAPTTKALPSSSRKHKSLTSKAGRAPSLVRPLTRPLTSRNPARQPMVDEVCGTSHADRLSQRSSKGRRVEVQGG